MVVCVRPFLVCLATAILLCAAAIDAAAQSRVTLALRGRPQQLYVYGPPGGEPVIVSSGDGGWIHLGPHVADVLSRRGFFVIGFDVRAYLESFTTRVSTLTAGDVPWDYHVLAEFAARTTGRRPLLIGVSEGAGLSVLAACQPPARLAVAGVVALGLPDVNELGWRLRDSLTYLTHGTPREPIFSTSAVVERVAPLPLAAIHSRRDEFVPVAEVQRVFDRAHDPKRLWLIDASNHRFSDKLEEFDAKLLEAMAWAASHKPE